MRYARYNNVFTEEQGDYFVRAVDIRSVGLDQLCKACEARNEGFSAQQVESVIKLLGAQVRSFLAMETEVNMDFVSFRLGVKGTIDPAGTGKVVKGVLHVRPARQLEALAAALPLEEVPPSQSGPALFSIEDAATGRANTGLSPGGMAVLFGHNIRIVNGHVKLRNVDSGTETLITGSLAENSASKVIFLVPASLAAGTWRVSVATCYSGGGKLLSSPHSAELDVDLAVPCPPAPGTTAS